MVRYLGWWIRFYRRTPLVVGAPLGVIAGSLATVDAIAAGDVRYLLKSDGILLMGLFVFVWPLFKYRIGPRPWRE